MKHVLHTQLLDVLIIANVSDFTEYYKVYFNILKPVLFTLANALVLLFLIGA